MQHTQNSKNSAGETLLRLAGWISLFLILFLVGCASAPVQTQQCLTVPPNLTAETPHPQFHGTNNGDLLRFLEDYRAALNQCNADKDSVRKVFE